MKILVFLGNPGSKYSRTRHNIGFMAGEKFAELNKIKVSKKAFLSETGTGKIEGADVLLLFPQTYMNESGRAIGPLLSWYKLEPQDLIVVHDDMDIPAGAVRIRRKGSAGGHNGIKSILYHVGDENFARVRIGIGRPQPGWTVVNHVLAPFSSEDAPKIREAIQYLLPAVECIVTEDVDMAMNRYNPKKQKKKKAEPETVAEEKKPDTGLQEEV